MRAGDQLLGDDPAVEPGAAWCPAPPRRRRTPRTRPGAAPGSRGGGHRGRRRSRAWRRRSGRSGEGVEPGRRGRRRAGASSSRPRRSPTCPARRFISQKDSAWSGESIEPPRLPPLARLAHERIQLELLLGAERHLGLDQRGRSSRAEEARTRLRARSPRPPASSGGIWPPAGCLPGAGSANGFDGQWMASAERDDAVAKGAERSVEQSEEAGGPLARLGLLVEPAVAEDEAVRDPWAVAPRRPRARRDERAARRA